MDILDILDRIGLASLLGVALGWLLHECSEQRRLSKKRRAIASVLRAEVEAVRDRYMQVIGNEIGLLKDGEYLRGSVNINEKYFTVFDSNVDLVSLINPQDAKKLLEFYITAKGHIDSMRTYKDIYENLNSRVEDKIAYSQQLRDDHQKLLCLYSEVLALLGRY